MTKVPKKVLRTTVANAIWVFRAWVSGEEMKKADWRFHLSNLAELEKELPALFRDLPSIARLQKELSDA